MLSEGIELRYNIIALMAAILREDITIPEMAFAVVQGTEYKPTYEDTLDMIELKKTMTYKAIGEIYGLSDCAVFRRIEYIKKKKSKSKKSTG